VQRLFESEAKFVAPGQDLSLLPKTAGGTTARLVDCQRRNLEPSDREGRRNVRQRRTLARWLKRAPSRCRPRRGRQQAGRRKAIIRTTDKEMMQ
jgi:hypothetical protein